MSLARTYGSVRQPRIHHDPGVDKPRTDCGKFKREVDARKDWASVDCKRCLRRKDK